MERISKLKAFLAENPYDSFLQHALALEYIKLGDEEQARVLFEEIINREPGYVGTYYHLAKLQERLGETDKAIQVYKKGMEEAMKAGANHAYGELRGAYEELTF
ncbi:MAG TPA: tetratricopeptide repeat protein [Chitinophagaceae bacterium]|nr:tetratricopeptide repeat protein [Chitinophagaceae bacterium]